MGTVAINEGVSLLEALSPVRLNELRAAHPQLADDLRLGLIAGDEDIESSNAQSQYQLLKEKASVMVVALKEAASAAQAGSISVSQRVRTARRQRLISEALVLIGSSSSLATLALSKNRATVIAAALTLLAALGNLFAEYQEKLLTQGGNIYDVFQKLGEGAYQARALSTELILSLKYDVTPTDMKDLVMRANGLCEQLNGWLVQLLSQIPSPQR
jgi:hypothetical protein